MSQPRRWWIGLLPLALVWLAANWIETPRVEADLLTRARQIVSSAAKDMTRSEVSVAGRDITIRGEAVQSGASQNVVTATTDMYGVRLVHGDVAAAQRQSPYVFSATREGNSVTLAGFASSDYTKERLLSAARSAFAGATFDDQIKLGAGAPPQFAETVAHGLQQLGKLSRGRFSLSDRAYSLEGIANDAASYTALSSLAGALPSGNQPGTIAITAPPVSPYTFAATRNGDIVTLTGHVPDVVTREKLLAVARAAYPDAKIEDKLVYASGAPQGLEALATHGLGIAGKLASSAFSLSGSVYNFSGAASDADGYDGALAALKALPTGASAGKIEVLAPEVKPYVWSVRRADDGSIALEGSVPSVEARDAILALAAKLYPGAKIDNRIQIARTAPEGFAAAAAMALEQIGGLKGGLARLSDSAWTLAGEAADRAKADAIAKAFGALPASMKIESNGIRVALPEVKPYTWSVRRAEDGSIILEGAVPSAAARDAILAQAAKLYSGAKIENRMLIARTAPEGFAAAASLALELVGKLRGGPVSLSDGTLSLSGEAADKSVADAVAQALATVGPFRIASNTVAVATPKPVEAPPVPQVDVPILPPPPLNLESEAPKPPLPPQAEAPPPPPPVEPPKPQPAPTTVISCERKGNAPNVIGTIYFEEGSYALSPDQEQALRGVLETIRRCGPDVRVDLSGHTNTHGDRAANIRLSSLRAFAASRWLQANGVPLRRIAMLGYGEDRLLMPETTDEAAAKNRRVEISIR